MERDLIPQRSSSSINIKRRNMSLLTSRANFRMSHGAVWEADDTHVEGRHKVIQCMISPRQQKSMTDRVIERVEAKPMYMRTEGATLMSIRRFLTLDTPLTEKAIDSIMEVIQDHRLSNAMVIRRIRSFFPNLPEDKQLTYWMGVAEFIKRSLDPFSHTHKKKKWDAPSVDTLNDFVEESASANISANKPVDDDTGHAVSATNDEDTMKREKSGSIASKHFKDHDNHRKGGHTQTKRSVNIGHQMSRHRRPSVVKGTVGKEDGMSLLLEDSQPESEIVTSRSAYRSTENIAKNSKSDRSSPPQSEYAATSTRGGSKSTGRFYDTVEFIGSSIALAKRKDPVAMRLLEKFPHIVIDYGSQRWSVSRLVRRVIGGVAALRSCVEDVKTKNYTEHSLSSGSQSPDASSDEESLAGSTCSRKQKSEVAVEVTRCKIDSKESYISDFLEKNWGGFDEDLFNACEEDKNGNFIVKQYDSSGQEHIILYDHVQDSFTDIAGKVVVKSSNNLLAEQRTFFDKLGREVINIPFLNQYEEFVDENGIELVNIASKTFSQQSLFDQAGNEVVFAPIINFSRCSFSGEKPESICESPHASDQCLHENVLLQEELPSAVEIKESTCSQKSYGEDISQEVEDKVDDDFFTTRDEQEDSASEGDSGMDIQARTFSAFNRDVFSNQLSLSSTSSRDVAVKSTTSITKKNNYRSTRLYFNSLKTRSSLYDSEGREIVTIPVEMKTSRSLFSKTGKPLTKEAKKWVQRRRRSSSSLIHLKQSVEMFSTTNIRQSVELFNINFPRASVEKSNSKSPRPSVEKYNAKSHRPSGEKFNSKIHRPSVEKSNTKGSRPSVEKNNTKSPRQSVENEMPNTSPKQSVDMSSTITNPSRRPTDADILMDDYSETMSPRKIKKRIAAKKFLQRPTLSDIPRNTPINPDTTQDIQTYLQKHGICQLFEMFTSSLVLERPTKPLDYLLDLVHEIGVRQTKAERMFRDSHMTAHPERCK